jgi:hypothetical protein
MQRTAPDDLPIGGFGAMMKRARECGAELHANENRVRSDTRSSDISGEDRVTAIPEPAETRIANMESGRESPEHGQIGGYVKFLFCSNVKLFC